MLEVRPTWGAACLLGPATVAVVLAIKGEDVSEIWALLPAVVGSAIGAVCTAAYAAYIQMSAGSFSQVGYC